MKEVQNHIIVNKNSLMFQNIEFIPPTDTEIEAGFEVFFIIITGTLA